MKRLWKMWENRDIKPVITEVKRNYLALKPNYHTTNLFSENLLAILMKRTQIYMNRPVYLGLSIFNISMSFGMIMQRQNMEKNQLCYMDKGSFIVYIKTK